MALSKKRCENCCYWLDAKFGVGLCSIVNEKYRFNHSCEKWAKNPVTDQSFSGRSWLDCDPREAYRSNTKKGRELRKEDPQ